MATKFVATLALLTIFMLVPGYKAISLVRFHGPATENGSPSEVKIQQTLHINFPNERSLKGKNIAVQVQLNIGSNDPDALSTHVSDKNVPCCIDEPDYDYDDANDGSQNGEKRIIFPMFHHFSTRRLNKRSVNEEQPTDKPNQPELQTLSDISMVSPETPALQTQTSEENVLAATSTSAATIYSSSATESVTASGTDDVTTVAHVANVTTNSTADESLENWQTLIDTESLIVNEVEKAVEEIISENAIAFHQFEHFLAADPLLEIISKKTAKNIPETTTASSVSSDSVLTHSTQPTSTLSGIKVDANMASISVETLNSSQLNQKNESNQNETIKIESVTNPATAATSDSSTPVVTPLALSTTDSSTDSSVNTESSTSTVLKSPFSDHTFQPYPLQLDDL